MTQLKRIGFFTRLLDDVPPAERLRLATSQICTAEKFGFDSAWVAQHHFHYAEGGLPSPLVFLAHVAAKTRQITLGTGIITLPLEDPIRAAEDAVTLDLLSEGRLQIGVGSGGTAASFAGFNLDAQDRSALYEARLERFRAALKGEDVGGGNRLYPPAGRLSEKLWQATFSVAGGTRAGAAGDGLMLSRTQPRPKDRPLASLADLQLPIIDAYYAALPPLARPRILASRTIITGDNRTELLKHAEIGLSRIVENMRKSGHAIDTYDLASLIRSTDTILGTPEEVAEQLSQDATLEHATDISMQVHSVETPHALTERAIELFATQVVPALGWHQEPQRRAV